MSGKLEETWETKPGEERKSRWAEMLHTVAIVAELAAVYDDNGIDVYFLNRPPLKNVTDASILEGKSHDKRISISLSISHFVQV